MIYYLLNSRSQQILIIIWLGPDPYNVMGLDKAQQGPSYTHSSNGRA